MELTRCRMFSVFLPYDSGYMVLYDFAYKKPHKAGYMAFILPTKNGCSLWNFLPFILPAKKMVNHFHIALGTFSSV